MDKLCTLKSVFSNNIGKPFFNIQRTSFRLILFSSEVIVTFPGCFVFGETLKTTQAMKGVTFCILVQ